MCHTERDIFTVCAHKCERIQPCASGAWGWGCLPWLRSSTCNKSKAKISVVYGFCQRCCDWFGAMGYHETRGSNTILNYWAWKNHLGCHLPVPAVSVPTDKVFSARYQFPNDPRREFRCEIIALSKQLDNTLISKAAGAGGLALFLESVRHATLDWADIHHSVTRQNMESSMFGDVRVEPPCGGKDGEVIFEQPAPELPMANVVSPRPIGGRLYETRESSGETRFDSAWSRAAVRSLFPPRQEQTATEAVQAASQDDGSQAPRTPGRGDDVSVGDVAECSSSISCSLSSWDTIDFSNAHVGLALFDGNNSTRTSPPSIGSRIIPNATGDGAHPTDNPVPRDTRVESHNESKARPTLHLAIPLREGEAPAEVRKPEGEASNEGGVQQETDI
ncbi:hypothetical protein B0T25DRAFT_527890 [Lasiosphaeria hispida]|uniref:Uncharacterized protein n=1 Tax=Lasiosphaeria hispida TaxID=260671 RepID=A0AAJ0HVC3_9PEZI|nr:hypothetical protein B0T25DRAFT_527890 [Lasiosphaeria hispida]